jgi:hypothetical protein
MLDPTINIALYVISYKYNKTNVMHFSFYLLRIKGFYMFRALLAHRQEVLHNRHLVYCVRVMSVGCTMIAVLQIARNILNAVVQRLLRMSK